MATLFEQLEEQPILFLKRQGFPIGGTMISSLTAKLIALVPPIPRTGNDDWSTAESNDENDMPSSQNRAQLHQFVNRTFPIPRSCCRAFTAADKSWKPHR
jgi:hypothetical protein